ncbi:MAG: winged helix-turn-helix transcriptional regulator [Aestuariibacter sp.]
MPENPKFKSGIPLPGAPVRGSATGRPVMAAMDLLGRRWALRLIWEMSAQSRGFRELRTICGGLSPSVLSNKLKELQAAGIVMQDENSQWRLTPLGHKLQPVILSLNDWSQEWARELAKE